MTATRVAGRSEAHTIPIGAMMSWHSVTPPAGWLLCNGQQVPIATYTQLYNALTNTGTAFPYGSNTNGAGAAGSTHFYVPNLVSYFPAAPSLLTPAVSGRNSNVGATAGSATHTHTWDLGLSIGLSGSSTHSHTMNNPDTNAAGQGQHTLTANLPASSGATNAGANGTLNTAFGAHVHNTNSSSALTDGHAGHIHLGNVTSPTTNAPTHQHSYNVSGNSYTPAAVTALPPYLTTCYVILAQPQLNGGVG
jgi:microcystin-dependent protein